MIGFLFASLGSLVFWAAYFMMSLFVGTFLIRKLAPRTYNVIKTGRIPSYDIWPEYVSIILANYIFWPIVLGCLLFYIIWKFVTESVIAPAFRSVFNFAEKVTPNIDIKIVKDNDEPF